jgi:hypothetical protein
MACAITSTAARLRRTIDRWAAPQTRSAVGRLRRIDHPLPLCATRRGIGGFGGVILFVHPQFLLLRQKAAGY